MPDEDQEVDQRHILDQIPVCEHEFWGAGLTGGKPDFFGVWDEGHIPLDVVCGLMVRGVGEAP